MTYRGHGELQDKEAYNLCLQADVAKPRQPASQPLAPLDDILQKPLNRIFLPVILNSVECPMLNSCR